MCLRKCRKSRLPHLPTTSLEHIVPQRSVHLPKLKYLSDLLFYLGRRVFLTVMTVKLDGNHVLIDWKPIFDSLNDFENEPCAVFENSAILTSSEQIVRLGKMVLSYFIATSVGMWREKLINNISVTTVQLLIG